MTDSPLTPHEVLAYCAVRIPDLKQQRGGAERRGRCPLHRGQHDSFAMDPETGRWFCHSTCGRGGDVIGLEMQLTSADFKHAKAEVYRIVGRPELDGNGNGRRRVVATYDYLDEEGKLSFQVVRTDPKGFYQQQPDGHGGWIRNLNGVRLVLFRLPELLKRPTETVFVCEGEKDVHSLEALGLVATCNPMGAGKWRGEYSEALRHRSVLFFPDNDPPTDEHGKPHYRGQKHVGAAAEDVLPAASEVRIVQVPKGKDVSDWIAAGGTREEIEALAASEPALTAETLKTWRGQWETDPDTAGPSMPASEGGPGQQPAACEAEANPAEGGPGIATDTNVKFLADRITAADHFARDAGGRLYVYQGGVYRPCGEKFILREVKRWYEHLRIAHKWATRKANEVVEYIGVDCPELWDQPPSSTLNLQNGLLDVDTRILREHDPKFLSAVQLPVKFDPPARCPEGEKFVAEVFPADAHAVAWEIVAWVMLPDRSIQKAVLLIGEGSNGKSVYLRWLIAFLGRGNTAAISLHRLEQDKFAAARLVGKLANICPDLPSTHLTSTSIFKALTGGDVLSAEFKFRDSFEFEPFSKLLFSANEPPRSDDATHGFFRRWAVVPFTRSFEEGSSDTIPREVLDAMLADPAELSGVLNKALDALPNIRKHGFTESESMLAAWSEFRQTTDPLAVWLDQNTVTLPTAMVAKGELIEAYNKHLAVTGNRQSRKQVLALRSSERGPQ